MVRPSVAFSVACETFAVTVERVSIEARRSSVAIIGGPRCSVEMTRKSLAVPRMSTRTGLRCSFEVASKRRQSVKPQVSFAENVHASNTLRLTKKRTRSIVQADEVESAIMPPPMMPARRVALTGKSILKRTASSGRKTVRLSVAGAHFLANELATNCVDVEAELCRKVRRLHC